MPLRTGDNNFGTAKWIVSAAYSDGCTHTTIASALTSASSGDTIFIRPGTYTENLTYKAGVNIVAYTVDAITPNVTIIGKGTYTSSGTISFSGIRLQTNSDYFLEVTGSNASVVNLYNCYLNCSNATGINFTAANTLAKLNIFYAQGDLATTGIGFIDWSSTGAIWMDYSFISNSGGSTTSSTFSAGSFIPLNCRLEFRIQTSGTAYIAGHYTEFFAPGNIITHAGNDLTNFFFCAFGNNANIGIVANAQLQLHMCHFNINNTTAIGGSSTVIMNGCDFLSGSGITASVSATQIFHVPKLVVQNLTQVLSGAGSPNGVITAPKGSFYMRTDGSGTSNRAYINTNGTTGWTALTTAS